jgi:hypothetical protein
MGRRRNWERGEQRKALALLRRAGMKASATQGCCDASYGLRKSDGRADLKIGHYTNEERAGPFGKTQGKRARPYNGLA